MLKESLPSSSRWQAGQSGSEYPVLLILILVTGILGAIIGSWLTGFQLWLCCLLQVFIVPTAIYLMGNIIVWRNKRQWQRNRSRK